MSTLSANISSRWQEIKKWGWPGIFVGAILGTALGVLATWIVASWQTSHTPHPFVAVILSNSDRNFTIPTELGQGIQQAMTAAAGPRVPAPHDQWVDIQFIQAARTEEATARAVRTGCLLIPDCVAIVGASDSTTTRAALNEIMNFTGGPRPALIMPIATATSLTETAFAGNYPQILRLVPNNSDQAQQIKSFIANRAHSQRVIVIVDPENPEYSHNLADIIVQSIRDNGGDPTRLEYADSRTLRIADQLDLSHQDFIVFVGTSNHGLDIVNDMIRYHIRVPIIFTDGNTVREVLEQSRSMPGPAYFLTPVAAPSNSGNSGYTAIGRDTYGILSNIFAQIPRPTRIEVARFISERKHDITLEPGAAGRYRFRQDGENAGMHFRIFSFRDGQVRLENGF